VTADWPSLEKLLDDGNTADVLAGVRDLDDKQRRALARPLEEYAKRWRAADPEVGSAERYRWYDTASALMVAVAGCLTASAAATWFPRAGSAGVSDPALEATLEATRGRPPAWREEVALRLAGLRGLPDGHVRELAVALVAEAGVEPPVTAAFALAWMWTVHGRRRPDRDTVRPLVDVLAEDPLLPDAHRLLFEPDEMGRHLQSWKWSDWPAALVTLAGDRRLDRGVILDACLRRLLRGGTPTQMRTYQQIYEGLGVSVDEAAARTGDLLSLLPDAPSTVAALAQAGLRRVEEAGRLPAEALAEACRAALFRPEKKVAAAQLSWLEAAIKQDPGRAPALLAEVTVAFGHPAPEVQQKAVALLARHSKLLDPEARAQAAAAADGLPSDLRDRLAGILGVQAPDVAPPGGQASGQEWPGPAGPAAEPSGVRPGLPPPPFTPAAMPAPIGSPAELTEQVAAILEATEQRNWPPVPVDPVTLERTLAGLVALTHADSAGMAAALAPVCSRQEIEPGLPRALPRFSPRSSPDASDLFRVIVGAAAGPGDPGRAAGWADDIASFGRLNAPLRVLMCRLLEIAIGLAVGPVPLLVATPTDVVGHLDPAALLTRVEQAAAEGWQPWENDLQQALLRLPREPAPRVTAAARRLGSPAGERLASWLDSGGLPDVAVRRVEYEELAYNDKLRTTERITMLGLAVEPGSAVALAPGTLGGMLLDLPDPRLERPDRGSQWAACWPAVAPWHRDLIAAYLRRAWRGGAELPWLAETDGPAGPGISLVIAVGLGAEAEWSWAATVDGLLILARRGQLDGTAVGADIATLVTLGRLKLARVVPRLRDAAQAGARTQVWDAIAAALPPLLTAALDKPPTGLADLVALGTELAPPAARPIPELAAYGAQKKGTRLAAEARRLHAHLTGEVASG
jgi:hypothetical protein